MEFTSQQREIIDQFGKGQAVLAGAGCGKTTTLVAKCLKILSEHPKKVRFCAVSFTEKSVRDLKEALGKGLHGAGLYEERHQHWVKTIHGLCATIIQEFPDAAGLQGGERILLEDESSRIWDRAMNALWSSNESKEVGESVVSLLQTYSKKNLEELLKKLRSLLSFGLNPANHPELKNLWICFESVNRRYEHSKKRMGVLDFNDLERYALAALEKHYVRKHFHQLFDLVLVDEFQDTNPLQGKILEYFARPNFSNLCIVGDPKQSIYRFRDADVSVFFDLMERLPLKHLLTENYRSRPEIIHFVNQVCAPIFEKSELAYDPLTPGRKSENNTDRVWKLLVKHENDLANFFKIKMAEGVDLSEYTILGRSLKGKAQLILRSLTQAGIPYVLGSGGRFYEDPRVQELAAFLKGFISTEHRFSQWSALRSPWIAIPEETLFLWKEDLFKNFFESNHAVAVALKNHYGNSKVRPGEILEILFELLDDEMSISVLSLWHKAEELSAQGLTYEEVLQNFIEAIEASKLEKEIPPPAQKGAVRVLTIHGSKGLQFPRVILLDFFGLYRGGAGFKDLIWDRKNGVHLFRRDEDGKKLEDDSENDFWSDLEKRNALAESKRLFYVAITRPQEELIFYWPENAKVSKDPDRNDDWRSWVLMNSSVPEKSFSDTPVPEIKKIQLQRALSIQKTRGSFLKYRPRHSPSEWRILDQCGLRYYQKWIVQTVVHEEIDATTDEIDSKKEKWKELASEKGERVHSYFEHDDFDSLKKVFEPELSSKLIEQARAALSNQLQIHKEFGFEVPLNEDEALVGMMDRLEVDPNQKLIRVIDYKWTIGPKSKAELLEDYGLQLQLYVWAAAKMVPFIPEKLEAIILHLTSKTVQVVQVPSLNLEQIEGRIKELHARVTTDQEARPGAHCQYCDYRIQCPKIIE